MKQHLNRILCACLALLLCVGLLALPASAEEPATSGTCGENLTWTLENGVFTISGSGAMTDYSERNPAPWQEHAASIQRLVVQDGVTTIGSMAFYQCVNLTVVSLPASVAKLNDLAFAECKSLVQITLAGVEEISFSCFYACESLVNVTLPNSLRIIGDQAFYCCKSLAGITIPATVTSLGNSAFSYCSDLVYVNILAPITVLPHWSFYGCSLLWDLTLPNTVETVEDNALAQCDSLFYVEFQGAQSAQNEISQQLEQKDGIYSGGSNNVDVSFEQTENAVITTKKDAVSGTMISVTVTDSEGWKDMTDSISETLKQGSEPEITVEVPSSNQIPKGALSDLSDHEVTVTIHTSDNVDWQVVLPDQSSSSLAGAQDLAVTVSKNNSDKYSDTIGDAQSFIVSMGETTLNSTVLLPLGKDTARKTATLYVVDGGKLRKLTSVIVDDDGKAAFSLAGTEEGKYVIALDVQDIPQEEVRVPEKLAPEYGIDYTYGSTLTDSQGNQYVLTGRVNKLGFGIGTLTLVVVGILVGSMILVGAVMVIWNKQQKQKQAWQRRNR